MSLMMYTVLTELPVIVCCSLYIVRDPCDCVILYIVLCDIVRFCVGVGEMNDVIVT
jgi:hypothetical protein